MEKSRNGDTLAPVELIGWPKQGNQGDQGDQSDQCDESRSQFQFQIPPLHRIMFVINTTIQVVLSQAPLKNVNSKYNLQIWQKMTYNDNFKKLLWTIICIFEKMIHNNNLQKVVW